jgi:hypothetical protein
MWLKNEAKARAAEAERVKTPAVEAKSVNNTAAPEAITADGAGDAAATDPEAVPQPAAVDSELPQASKQDPATTEVCQATCPGFPRSTLTCD